MHNKKRGITTLFLVLTISAALLAIVMSLTFVLTAETRETGYRAKEIQALYLAEAGIAKAILDIQTTLEATYSNNHDVATAVAYLDTLMHSTIISEEAFGAGTFEVTVSTVEPVSYTNQRDVYLHATATVANVQKKIRVIQTFGFAHSKVFDHSYFINNYGWLYGGAEIFQGDLRANGTFKVIGNQKINGDVYATAGVDESQGKFVYDSLSNYYSSASTRARPGDPAYNGGGVIPGGYDGFLDNYDSLGNARDPARPQIHPTEEAEDMPYLGDLNYYKQLAQTYNGTIKIGGITKIANVYNGNIILTGTAANPIVISGPVVATGDVILKGVVSGQGTIYTGRNIHIIDNITYKTPPNWPKPDYNPAVTAITNKTKDFLGLSAKGNVIFGDYNSAGWTQVKNWIQPPFTKEYAVDQTDADIGYAQYYKDGIPYFDGNYLSADGGKKSDNSTRCYYESSLSNTEWNNLSPTNNISQIDAMIYTNHAVTGRVTNNNINGSVIGRDDGIVFSGYIKMNFDYRVLSQGNEFVDLRLPISVMTPIRKSWRKE